MGNSAAVARAMMALARIFADTSKSEKERKSEIQTQVKTVRKTTGDEKRWLPGPMMKKCYDILWGKR